MVKYSKFSEFTLVSKCLVPLVPLDTPINYKFLLWKFFFKRWVYSTPLPPPSVRTRINEGNKEGLSKEEYTRINNWSRKRQLQKQIKRKRTGKTPMNLYCMCRKSLYSKLLFEMGKTSWKYSLNLAISLVFLMFWFTEVAI